MIARTIIGVLRRHGLTPELSIGISSLFAASVDRKYVTENRNAMDATISRYCGSESRMYSAILAAGMLPFMI